MKKKLLSAVSLILVLTMIMAFPLEVFAKGKEPGKKPEVGPAPEVRSGGLTASYFAGDIPGESENYKVVISVDESAEIPEGTVARITEFIEGSDEYEDAKAKVIAEKGEDAFEGFAAFDITLYNGDEIIEPASAVKVSIEAKGLPEDATGIEINHIDESGDEAVVELVASDDDIVVDGDTLNAEISVEGFSTFVLIWSVGETAQEGNAEAEETGAESEYSEKTMEKSAGGITVTVDVPEGALPDDAEMVLTELTADQLAAVEEAAGSPVIAALDISFWSNDEEIQPQEAVIVSMSSPEIAAAGNTTVIHIEDETGEAVEVAQEPESLESEDVIFEAVSFSTYAVVATAFQNNQQYVIYTGTTALAYNGTNLTTATVTVENGTVVRSSSDNIVWTATQNGTNWRLYYTNGTGWQAQNRYLHRNNNNLDTRNGGNNDCNVTYNNYYHRLTVGGRYLTYNNGTWGLTQTESQAATVYIALVGMEPVTGELTYNYYNADHSASISAAETVADDHTTTWTNVSTLAKEIEGYQYLEARANSVDGDVITEVNGRAYRKGTETSGTGSTLNSIYFIYMHDYVAGEDVIPGLNGPETEKQVTHNPDGTFTIQLDVTGVVNDVKHGANVVVVFDRTYSMSGTMSSSDRTMRINAAISAVNTMVDTLNPGDPSVEGQYDIDFALVEFDRAAEDYDFGTDGITGHTNWTKSGDALKTRVSRYTDGENLALSGSQGAGGTNWQAALQATAAVLENKPDADPTYVIFMTDGEPTIYIGSSSVNTNRTTNDPEYSRAVPYATAIVNADYLMYDIFCSASDTTLLNSLYTASGAKSYVEAETTAAIEAAFAAVAQDMIDAIGSSNYGVDDGVPSMGSFDLSTVDGVAQLGDARYYIKTEDDEDFTVWTDAPVATESEAGVLWDLSSVGTLAGGTVYRIQFEIWPSQAAYDLIADLNNQKIYYDYAAYQAAGGTKTEEQALADGDILTADQRLQITQVTATTYTLKTNTSLSATYKLYGQTINDDDIDYTADAMDLPTKKISVKKLWPENMLDKYGEAAYRDPKTGETMYASEIDLTLQREVNGVREDYLDFTVSKDGPDGDPETTADNWTKGDIYVSCGFMTVADGVVTIKETGHDYQIVEPPEFMYYWDLISDIYHPMVINGVDTVLVYDPDITAADVENGIYEIPADSGRFYKTQTDTSNILEASNYRRSNLNLSKVIPEGANEDAEFVYKVTVTDAYSTDGNVWFSAWDNNAGALVTDIWVTGTDVVAQGDGYFYAPNGTELTMTIKTGWNVRFLNVYHGTTFSIEETGMPGNFEFEKVEAATQYDFMLESNKDWYQIEVDEDKVQTGKITGTITEPNNNYNITYSNKVKPEFYIYHSGVEGDGNLEVIPMSAVNADGTYNLYAKTTAGTLYGGYYLDYKGKGTYSDDGVAGTSGVKYTGMNIAWGNDAQTVDGTKMKPLAGETYYIKEVPTYYLQNYHQINYVKSSGKLMALYLISAVDDLHYNETGFLLASEDSMTAKVALSMTYKNTATNRSVTLKANTVFKSKGITGTGSEKNYLTYWDATESEYFKVGEFTVQPYWVTPDGITVKGISVRTITITDMTKAGISKSDS